MHAFYTIGHSTRSIRAFVDLLRAGAVAEVVDIRTVPRSRTNPHYNEEALPAALAPYGISCRRIAALGGLRGRARDVPPETNGWWENRSFHNYADHALAAAFAAGLDELVAAGRAAPVAMMCSEAVWWRCHRRIVADWLLARGATVLHLMDGPRLDPATLTPAARVGPGGVVTYPA